MITKKDELKKYIIEDMTTRMQHVYQPEMLMTILDNDGRATTTEIAKRLLSRDSSQIEYYEERVKQMVGRVLVNNGIVTKDDNVLNYSDLRNSPILT